MRGIIRPLLRPLIEPILEDMLLATPPELINSYIIQVKKSREMTIYDIMHKPMCENIRFAVKYVDNNDMACTDTVKGSPQLFFNDLNKFEVQDIKYIEDITVYARYRYKGKSDSVYHGFTKYNKQYGPKALTQAIESLQTYAQGHPEIFL